MTLRRKAMILAGGTFIGFLVIFSVAPTSRFWTIIGMLLFGGGLLTFLDRFLFTKAVASESAFYLEFVQPTSGAERFEQKIGSAPRPDFKLRDMLPEDIIDSLPDATFIIDNDKKVVAWNRAMEELTGVKKDTILGKGYDDYSVIFHDSPSPLLIDLVGTDEYTPLHEHVEKKGDTLQSEVYAPGFSNGKGAFLWAKASPVINHRGEVCGAIESIRDITTRTEAEERLRYLSIHDALTGLYNRACFTQEMYRLTEEKTAPVTIFICDIDGLKLINDTMGHHTGDDLILHAAKSITAVLPETAITARVAGDEFAILLPGVRLREAEQIYHNIHQNVSRFNQSGVFDLPIALTIGYASTDVPLTDLSFLFKEADNNMFHEKLHYNHNTQTATIQILMKALEVKDFVKEGHVDRLQSIVASVGAALGMTERRIRDLRLLAKFHDIGKVGIPDRILLKQGPLSPAEVGEIQRHCEFGFRIAQSAPVLVPIADGILKHHEWWNGKGYPLGLQEKEIPLDCRLLAIADAYDALTSDRPYRKAMPPEKAASELLKRSGTQFDPELLQTFLNVVMAHNRQTKITVLNN